MLAYRGACNRNVEITAERRHRPERQSCQARRPARRLGERHRAQVRPPLARDSRPRRHRTLPSCVVLLQVPAGRFAPPGWRTRICGTCAEGSINRVKYSPSAYRPRQHLCRNRNLTPVKPGDVLRFTNTAHHCSCGEPLLYRPRPEEQTPALSEAFIFDAFRGTGWLGRRDSNLCISKSDLLNFIPLEQDLGLQINRLG